MSLGFTRLNVKKSSPNANITFIKPLGGLNEAIARDFLERIAAQCYPVMKNNHIHVRSLEEYEPNKEFVGRNFNAGEVVQLVLRSVTSGRWLPFEYVQMVMMHELAHCKQMNHSHAFWAVRNSYARQMEALWSSRYTGEGIWGAGRELSTGNISRLTILTGEVVPEHICGGTYRTNTSRGRKRKPVLSYREQKERRILKKFGANGQAVGADDKMKKELEGGKKITAKPRVAGSARGRELRAAAAAVRFEKNGKLKDEEKDKKSDIIELISDSENEYEEDPAIMDAVDINGKKLTDKDGNGMIKTCGDEDANDDEIKELEFNEWQDLSKRFRSSRIQGSLGSTLSQAKTNLLVKKESTLTIKKENKSLAQQPQQAPYITATSSNQPTIPSVLRQLPRSSTGSPMPEPLAKSPAPRSASMSRVTAIRMPESRGGKKAAARKALGFTKTLGSMGDPLPAEAAAAAARRRNGQPSVVDMLKHGRGK